MTYVLGIGAIFALILGIVISFALPSLLNVGISAFVAFHYGRRWYSRTILFIAVSATISLGLRMPSLLSGDHNVLRMEIPHRTLVLEDEKVRLDSDMDIVFFRKRFDPPHFGMDNSWRIGMTPVETVYENPKSILEGLGITSSTNGESRVVLRIRSERRGNILAVNASVIVNAKTVSTYSHEVRAKYPLEDFNYYGKFPSWDWKAVFLYLTQDTFWGQRGERFNGVFSPLNSFIQAALAKAPISASTASANKVWFDLLNVPEKLRILEARIDLETMREGKDVPPNSMTCHGADSGRSFSAYLPNVLRWKDEEINRHFPNSYINGYLVFPQSIACAEHPNEFWIGAYHLERINLWRYRMDGKSGVGILEEWLQSEVPEKTRELFEKKWIGVVQIEQVRNGLLQLNLVNRYDRISSNRTRGYRVEISAR
jgi:hypothetical protein